MTQARTSISSASSAVGGGNSGGGGQQYMTQTPFLGFPKPIDDASGAMNPIDKDPRFYGSTATAATSFFDPDQAINTSAFR